MQQPESISPSQRSPDLSRVRAWLDFADPRDPGGPRWRGVFAQPLACHVAYALHQVPAVLAAVEQAARQGLWCVGFLRYEAAPAFDAALHVRPWPQDAGAAASALAWFAVFERQLDWVEPGHGAAVDEEVSVAWHQGLDRVAFDRALAHLEAAISAGEFYQVNYTQRHRGQCQGAAAESAQALFAALRRAQPGGYQLLLDTGDEQVLSVSPELFFDWHDGRLLTRPMKGTLARGRDADHDRAQAQALRDSAKDQAENVMIVDLLRNDVSRLAQPGSVRVSGLFQLQALPAVWQMTSDVEAQTRVDVGLVDVFGALFPCGSVTGAPKVRAMQAIAALEDSPRGVYCGALGVVQPGGRATFNVPIRTLTVQGRQVVCGVGSGITAGSRGDDEWREWRHKQAFVERASEPFDLLETLRLQEGAWVNLPLHLERLTRAARHFGFVWNPAVVHDSLQALRAVYPAGSWRVRLVLSRQGTVQAQAFVLEPSPQQVTLAVSDGPFEAAHGEFVRYKTTRRAHYEAHHQAQSAKDPGIYDTLLWNEEGEFTECTRGNVAFRLAGRWLTPPLACGLLDGVGRAQALREGWLAEGVVRLDDLPQVEAVRWLNSLRGVIEARLTPAQVGVKARRT